MATFPMLLPRYDGPETTPLYENSYQRSAVEWCNAAFEEAEYDQNQVEELNMVQGYIDYLEGKQWNSNRPKMKSRPVNNRMIRLYWELVGQLTDIRPVAEVRTTQMDPDAAIKRASSVLNNGMRAWALDSDFDLRLAKCISWAVLSTSFAKFQWNPALNFGQGDIEMVPLGPDTVMPLKCGGELDTAEAIIYKEALPLRRIRAMYPQTGSMVQADERFSNYQLQPQAPANVPPFAFALMQEGLKRKVSGAARSQASAVPMAQVREFWIKDDTYNESKHNVHIGETGKNWSYIVPPGGQLYPRGRLIVMGGERVVLWDGPNPYWHGKPPFVMMRLNIVPWQLFGLSDLRSQVPLQDIINNILAGVLDAVKRAVNPAFFAPKNAFSPEVWQSLDFSLPSARAAYSPQSAHEPKFVPAPVLPGFVLAMMQAVEREMDQTSTGAIASEAARKKQVPSADGLEQLKAEKQTPVRLKGRNIESFLRAGGQMMVSNMIQFWTVKRRMQMLGTQGLTFEDFDWDPGTMVPSGSKAEEFIKKFKFYIQPGSLLTIKRVEEKMEALMLRKMGAIDLETMYEKLGGDYDAKKIINRLLEEAKLRAQNAPPKPPKGKPH